MTSVSILLPTHNGARFIRRAIESVRAQTLKEWELIIINDGSSDATGSLIAEIASIDERIRIISLGSNKGIQKALNEGLMQARTNLIARIDDDDVWSDQRKLEKQVAFLAANPSCVLVGTGLIVQNEEGDELYRFLNPESDAAIRKQILYRNCFSHSTVMFLKSAAMQFNGYDESEATLHTEDYDLWLKLGTIGTFANIPEYSVRFTSRLGAISNTNKLVQFKRQLALTAGHCASYPDCRLNRSKSFVRYYLYWLLGTFVPVKLQNIFIRYYKRA